MTSTLRRRAALGISAALGAAALLTGGASSALAASGLTDEAKRACPPGYFCIFQFENYRGDHRFFTNTARSGYFICDFRAIPSPFDNKASSMVNRTDRNITLYSGYSCNGDRYAARPNSEDTTFENNGFDNRASGINFPTRP